jgi:hypothetical protein
VHSSPAKALLELAQLLNIDALSLLALAQLQTSAQQSCIILLTLAQLLNNHAQSLQSPLLAIAPIHRQVCTVLLPLAQLQTSVQQSCTVLLANCTVA